MKPSDTFYNVSLFLLSEFFFNIAHTAVDVYFTWKFTASNVSYYRIIAAVPFFVSYLFHGGKLYWYGACQLFGV